ncbi:helix-turn-helix domain-containing protein [Pararhizobium sp. A13]|uniref:helix-turn-helix domain-containing protein n=1 Tax=Pararhizobium sp. A13 TaxID=3133975 RepID=UPI00325280BD
MKACAQEQVARPFSTPAGTAVDRAPSRVAVQAQPILPDRSPVPAFEFSTLDLPPEEQFAAWRNSYAPMVDVTAPDNFAGGFAGEQTTWDLGGLAFSHVKTSGMRFASLAGHVRREPMDHWTITLILRGDGQTVAPARTCGGGAGSVKIHSLGKVFEGYVTDSELLSLVVPRDFCGGMAHVLEPAEFSTLEQGMARLFGDYMTSLARCLPSLKIGDLPQLVTATRALILACVAPSPDHFDEAGDPVANILLERARRFVQANVIAPGLGVTSLQRELGISRSRLYRLFEPYGGVVHYIQHRRLLDAHAALADPADRRRILDIGEERGFADGAEFSRAFRREFGYSPSEVRAAGRRDLPSRPDSGLETVAPGDRLGALLRRLQA